MRVMLIVPTHHYKEEYPSFLSVSDFPTGYGYIASSLSKAGHEVVGLNLNNITGYKSAYQMAYSKIDEALQRWKPNLIGIGGLCTDYAFIKDAMMVCRKFAPCTPIVLGGGIINNDAEFIFKLLKPDYAIMGEAEEVIVKLANLIDGKPESLTIDNLWYWKDGKAVFTKTNYDYGDINSRPFPNYEPFGIKDMLDNYSMATRLLYRYSKPFARPFNIVASRSCPFSCTFCVHGHTRPHYRSRSIKNVMEEIQESYEKYHYNILIVLDELFAVSKGRLKEFAEGVLQGRHDFNWDFDWMFQTHASAKFDKETLELAKKAGCFFFSYGIESASPRVLKSMNKKARVPQFVEAIKLAEDAKIGFGGNLIFGDPAETEDTIYESMEFWSQHCHSAFVFLGAVVPYPGSKIFDDSVKRGLIKDKTTYYETLGQVRFNMTSMNNQEWSYWLSFFDKTEHGWWGVKSTDMIRWEKESETNPMAEYYGLSIYKVWAKCPYCGEEVVFRNIFDLSEPLSNNAFWGLGCPTCNRKIKIKIAGLGVKQVLAGVTI